ncbi:ABC transporter ATP-binding protein [Planctomicrobium sp. SH668]|uniref:ABC transporter ATP-binding protein n=1 Tax=Planctomicrobium sp. SH668 TaxID=3448126 RepID=UPI003F5C0756
MNPVSHSLLVKDVAKSFSTVSGDLSILTAVNLELKSGDAVAITGPSGSGKSTLLYIIGLLDTLTSGSVEINGQNPLILNAVKQAHFRSEQIGFVFQDHHLLPQCTVLENVVLPALATGGIGAEQEQRAKNLLERVGLAHRMDHVPSQLSGGERQRAAVCRALINQPALLLADEPTGNLDRKSADAVGALLLEIAQEQQAILVCVTHSQELAQRMPKRYELQDGRLV